MHVFVEGVWETAGSEKMEYFHVNWGTVDQPPLTVSVAVEGQEVVADGEEDWAVDLSKVKMYYFDGLKDNWAMRRKETPYRGGLL